MKIAREGWPWILVPLAASAMLAWFLDPRAALPGLGLAAFVTWFFRDPERTTPLDPRGVYSPADGRVIQAGPRRVSVFMNVFDVHVCRAPMAGEVRQVEHHAGRFFAAYRDRASEHNERVSIVIDQGSLSLQFTLVAGLIARRIVARIGPGQRVGAGQRIGLIQFGSRVDLVVPDGAEVLTRCGERVVAGESLVARLPPSAG